MFPTHFTHQKNLLTELNALYAREMPHPLNSLAAAAEYHFRNPGKSFRAQLALSSGLALGLNTVDNLHWAAACELLHNASLIHDDISDASIHRRGQESIHQHFGSDMALCLGDWMVAKAFELGARNTQYGGVLVALLAHAMQETCSGQISDITQRQCAEIAQWQRIAKSKAVPLLVAPIKGAAVAVGMGPEIMGLEQLIGLCGMAYQGRNDIEDVIPSSHRSSDLDGRKPNLVISLFAKEGVGREDFLRWYHSEDFNQLAHWQRRIASSEVILEANVLVDSWLLEAEQLVSSLPPQLHTVAHSLVSAVQQKTEATRQGQIA